jgi:hypothetical protein
VCHRGSPIWCPVRVVSYNDAILKARLDQTYKPATKSHEIVFEGHAYMCQRVAFESCATVAYLMCGRDYLRSTVLDRASEWNMPVSDILGLKQYMCMNHKLLYIYKLVVTVANRYIFSILQTIRHNRHLAESRCRSASYTGQNTSRTSCRVSRALFCMPMLFWTDIRA